MSFNDATIKLDKLYYSIGEVANYFDVNSSLIRFWEKEFSIIKPAKNKKLEPQKTLLEHNEEVYVNVRNKVIEEIEKGMQEKVLFEEN